MIAGRAKIGAAVIVAWLVGLGLLVRREYFRPQLERLAEAAARVTPGAVFYGVMQGSQQVGYASSTIDTAETSITVTDRFVADRPAGGKAHRSTIRTNVTLSRALRMTKFDIVSDTGGPQIQTDGVVEGDSVLILSIASGAAKPETRRVALAGPILSPTLVPLALALTDRPKIGKHYLLPVFDPSTMAPTNIGLDVRAESVFVVNDSSAFDSTSKQWHGIQPDTVRAWRIESPSTAGFSGWVDEQGRVVATTQHGLALVRLPYEVAFENWRNDSTHLALSDDRNTLETTVLAANKRMDRLVAALRVRLTNADLASFDLNGPGEHLSHDTLAIDPLPDSALWPHYFVPNGRQLDPANTRPEPLLQSDNPTITQLAYRITSSRRDPRLVAELINTWVHDSIANRVTFGVPNALQVLQTHAGDCNEHTQLFVALARSIGLPARVATGLAYVDGKFYYHAWPEVLLREWVAVDPTFGQFPADAAHLRFAVGGFGRQTELLRLMSTLKIDVLSVNARPTAHGPSARP